MELYENRIINGVLKSDVVREPEEARALLSQDIEIVAHGGRATQDDLWPCIWALASVLQRQFSGKIFIRVGLTAPLSQPLHLGSRCQFASVPAKEATLRIYIGRIPDLNDLSALWGDARGACISYQSLLEGNARADPISCFALAGYLGFAALATAVRIPAFRKDLVVGQLDFSFGYAQPWALPKDGLTFIGLGQLGQAYLSLLFFLTAAGGGTPPIVLLDKDSFEPPNYSTQILLEEGDGWVGLEKAKLLAIRMRKWRWNVEGEVTELTWNWKRPAYHPRLAVLGLDDLGVRRMAIAAGYDWLVDAGLGTSFLTPRLSWHSLPPDPALARELFGDGRDAGPSAVRINTPFVKRLKETPGGCGWVTFQNIQASAPALGLVTAAFVWSEIACVLRELREPIQGRAIAWSPLLLFYRRQMN